MYIFINKMFNEFLLTLVRLHSYIKSYRTLLSYYLYLRILSKMLSGTFYFDISTLNKNFHRGFFETCRNILIWYSRYDTERRSFLLFCYKFCFTKLNTKYIFTVWWIKILRNTSENSFTFEIIELYFFIKHLSIHTTPISPHRVL